MEETLEEQNENFKAEMAKTLGAKDQNFEKKNNLVLCSIKC